MLCRALVILSSVSALLLDTNGPVAADVQYGTYVCVMMNRWNADFVR